MPAQDRVRRDKSRDLCEQPATKRMYQLGEATPLAVLETKALAAAPGFQQAILFAQERDDISLLTLEPAAKAAVSNWNGNTDGVYAIGPIHLWALRHSNRAIRRHA